MKNIKYFMAHAVHAYETAIHFANEEENYKAFIEHYGEGNGICQMLEACFDLWVSRDERCEYLRELQEMCGDIYSMIEAIYSK